MKHQIFMDGVFITEKTLTNTWPTFNNFIIGAANTSCCGDYWSGTSIGTLDDIRVYNRALTNAEVQDIYVVEKP